MNKFLTGFTVGTLLWIGLNHFIQHHRVVISDFDIPKGVTCEFTLHDKETMIYHGKPTVLVIVKQFQPTSPSFK